MIKAIIFDLWNTMLAKGVSLSGSMHTRFHIPKYPGFVKEYERSIQLKRWRSREAEAKALLHQFRIPETAKNIAYVVAMVKKAVRTAKPNQGMPALLRQLRRSYRLGLLSNTSYWERDVVAKTGIKRYFDVLVFSFAIRSLKPAARPYQTAMKQLGVKPAECLFIDDTLENVIAARKLGMQGIWYQNTVQLKRELRKRQTIA